MQVYSGSAWVAVGGALTYITQVTPTAVNTISINNCFTSTYANYLIVMESTASVGNGTITARLRVGGVDATTNYTSQRLIGQGASAAAGTNPTGTDDWYFGSIEASFGSTYGMTTTIFSPALVRHTVATTTMGKNEGSGTTVQLMWSNHTAATAYDGITFNYSGTSFTGTIRVYGYQNS